jgi:hypothetical protein
MKSCSMIAAVLLLFACSPAAEVKDDQLPEPIMPAKGGGEMIAEKGDVSGDGKPDVWNYYKETADPDDPTAVRRVLVKKEADLNFDGTRDIVREFDLDGLLFREEADLDYDGHVDQVNLYEKGVLAEKQIYRSGGRKIFIWKFFKDGKMVRLHRDQNNDGRPDYCELWYAGEKLSKKGWDKTGDGECDYWENAD